MMKVYQDGRADSLKEIDSGKIKIKEIKVLEWWENEV